MDVPLPRASSNARMSCGGRRRQVRLALLHRHLSDTQGAAMRLPREAGATGRTRLIFHISTCFSASSPMPTATDERRCPPGARQLPVLLLLC